MLIHIILSISENENIEFFFFYHMGLRNEVHEFNLGVARGYEVKSDSVAHGC